jgi:hypothetical protein
MQSAWVLTAVFASGMEAMAQSARIAVQPLDGRNGKPLAGRHLLVFTGESPDAVRSHAAHVDLTTDESGAAELAITSSEVRWIQVWADGQVLCQLIRTARAST